MRGIVDRIEGKIVVIEVEDKMYNVDIEQFNLEIKEGDCVDIEIKDGKVIKMSKDEQATLDRKKYIDELTKNMWR